MIGNDYCYDGNCDYEQSEMSLYPTDEELNIMEARFNSLIQLNESDLDLPF